MVKGRLEEAESIGSSSKSKLPRDSDNKKILTNKHLYRLVLINVMQIWFLQGDRSKVPPDLNDQLQGNY